MYTTHPDPTVAHELATWAPRMIVQGIDYNLVTTVRLGENKTAPRDSRRSRLSRD
jgi:hypothetical protein